MPTESWDDLTTDKSELQPIEPESGPEGIIPSGIVNSQIRRIYGLPHRHCPSPKSSELAARERENTHFGWGRRLHSRFVPTVVRHFSANEPWFCPRKHSFLALNSGRKMHDEEHALVVDRLGSPNSMLPSSVKSGALRQACSLDNLRRKFDKEQFNLAAERQSTARIVDSNLKPTSLQHTTFIHRAPSESLFDLLAYNDDAPEKSLSSRVSRKDIGSHRRRPPPQSWLNYGYAKLPRRASINEDPALLLDGNASPRGFCRVCHVCSARTWASTHCYFCGHQLCNKCRCEVPEDTANAHADFSHHPSPAIPRDGPHHVQPSNLVEESKEHAGGTYEGVPTTIHEDIFEAEKASEEESSTVAAQKSRAGPGHVHIRHGHHTSSIQQNPFLIADKEARARTATNESIPQAECDDPFCRATHAGHYPFRHSVACALQRGRMSESQKDSAEGSPGSRVAATKSSPKSRTSKPGSSIEAPDSGNDTVHRHHSAGFHNTHHIIEHLSAAIGHDAQDYIKTFHSKQSNQPVGVPPETANRANIGPPCQLEPVTQIQPVTRIASFQYTQDIVPPGHPRHDGHRHASNLSNHDVPETSEPRETAGEDWRESQSVQEHYRRATLRAEAELSKLLSTGQETEAGRETRRSWPSEATPASEIITMPLQPRQIESRHVKAHASGSEISLNEATRREATTIPDRPSDLDIHRPTPIAPPNHDCTWKERYLALTAEIRLLKAEMSSRATWKESETMVATHSEKEVEHHHHDEDLGIEGLTIVMHLRGKDDLVINTDLTQDLD
ncbi:hypothetical protein F4810DRAFT_705610 [Camillea tinctor]|nr:hypothetical protein F4810DRAFT_705610 [Camillea tinctor]